MVDSHAFPFNGYAQKFLKFFFILWTIYLLDLAGICIIVGSPMGTTCAPLETDLFCYGNYFILLSLCY